ncbi:MAG: hypothetical protein IJU13_02605 [Bacteroidales bacterium]|nr:hypothetical protein [Bacteroidales bacterium]
MKTVALTGLGDCGKSYSIYQLAGWLLDNGWRDDSQGLDSENICQRNDKSYEDAQKQGENDIQQVFVNSSSGIRILLHAPMDNELLASKLISNIESLKMMGKRIDFLITSLRRFDSLYPNGRNIHCKTIQLMNWRCKGDDLLDLDGQEIIQIPLLNVKNESDKDRVVEWYNQRAAKLLQILVENLVENHQ